MPLINCKIRLELNWIEDCILSSAGNSAKFKITDAKLKVLIVTLSTKDNINLTKQLSNGFKRLFVLSYVIGAGAANNEAGINNNKMYFLPRGEIENYNVLVDEWNFYDQPINDLIKQYDEVRKVSTGQGDDYTTGCLLDYAYFKDN